MTSSLPAETTRLNRSPRRLWSRAENTDPEWLTTATGPGSSSGGSGYPQTRRRCSRLKNPMPLPPHTAIPASRATAASRSARGGTPGGGGWSSTQLAKMTAAGTPAAAAAVSWASRAALGTASTARSTGPGRSARDGWQGRPATSRWRGLTRWTAPR